MVSFVAFAIGRLCCNQYDSYINISSLYYGVILEYLVFAIKKVTIHLDNFKYVVRNNISSSRFLYLWIKHLVQDDFDINGW